MNRTMRLIVMGWLVVGLARTAAGQSSWLADEKANDKWAVSDGGSTLSIDAQAAKYPRLALSLDAVKRGPVTMSIQTDAPYVGVLVGSRRVRLELGEGTHVVRMDASAAPGRASITLDGKSDEKMNESWKQGVENAKADKVELRFGKCGGVKIKLSQGAAESGEADTAKPQAAPAPGSEKPVEKEPLSEEELTKLAESSVLELVIHRSEGARASGATVTVLDLAGHGVAMLHELIGATKVEARRAGFAEAIPVRLTAIDAEHDLALVQLDLSNPLARAVVRFIEVADDQPGKGDKVWALAPSPGSDGLLQAMKVVKVAGSTSELDRRTQAALTHSPSTQWLEVDAVLDAAHSGGAVVNERGRLVGIGTWVWVAKRKSSPVVSATHVKALLAAHMNDAPDAALGWDGLAKLERGPVMRYTTFPRLAPGSKSEAASGQDDPLRWLEVRKQVRLLEQNELCPVCKGEGLYYQRKQVGTSKNGGLAVPMYVSMPEVCPRCGGTGLNEGKVLEPLLERAAKAGAGVAASGEDNKGWVTTRDQLTSVLKKLGEEHYAGLAKLTAGRVKTVLGGGPAQIGQPVVVVGTLMRKVNVPGVQLQGAGAGGGRPGVRLGDVKDKDAQRVLVGDAVYVGEGDERLALVMGELAGWVVYSEDEPAVAVVSRAWVVPLDQAKVDEAVKKQKDAITEANRKAKELERQIEQQQQEQQRQQQQKTNSNNNPLYN
ncbi:MAG: trypsin-like peptidase domain-containing protein [Phycisphaerales bacterium]